MLMLEGRENGISRRANAAYQSRRNVFFGTRSIAKARMTVMTKISTAPDTLICNKLMPRISFQVADDLF